MPAPDSVRDYDHGRNRVGWKSRLADIPRLGNKVSIIMVAYERPTSLRASIASVLAQSWDDWELIVMHDGPASDAVRKVIATVADPRIHLVEGETKTGSFGNHNRHRAEAELASGNWVMHTNDDNYYAPVFLEMMLHTAVTAKAEFVYCNFVASHYTWRPIDARIEVGYIDYGAFMARRELASRAPWPAKELFYADGLRALALEKEARGTAKCESYLFVHN